ncbi:selenium cofactor biosynthesis protein YqeC [Sphaerochaeta sp. PS]|uniref:selenium cofactor biosynthesis protein YqeC n=1 Tax=Sphaerochaeta sp. PS TaxID=3076336 RepID=UPI0028A50DA7|nr:selenium cofactor biosynthesis protein YqeC [Sphaerochaeta sp. PS]MDT4762748.1 selenium cofactor biosynthesis protein YqeC [Sphaerochaeta sp. PS]
MDNLLEELQTYLSSSQRCITLTGSGGKTTCMIALAKAYAHKDNRVLVSTTTKLVGPDKQEYGCDTYFFDERVLSYHPSRGERVFYTHLAQKAVAPPLENLEALLDRYDVVVLEGDGSMNLGLKLHVERDPVVPSFTTATICLASFSLLGEPFRKNCFGSEHYTDAFPDSLVTLETYERLLHHGQGILKSAQGKTVVLFNQCREEDLQQCKKLSLMDLPSQQYALWFGSLKANKLIYRKPV